MFNMNILLFACDLIIVQCTVFNLKSRNAKNKPDTITKMHNEGQRFLVIMGICLKN